jgi:hypothetical protein
VLAAQLMPSLKIQLIASSIPIYQLHVQAYLALHRPKQITKHHPLLDHLQ